MERSEPSLVPQWLKGASSGGIGAASHYLQASSNHQEESGGGFALRTRAASPGLLSGGRDAEYDAPRFPLSSSSDRAHYSAVNRGPGGGSGISDRSKQERENSPRWYTNFGRSSTYRSYDGGLDRSDRDSGRERDWDWDQDRSRALGEFGGSDERERERAEQFDSLSSLRRPGLGQLPGSPYEADLSAPLRRVQSMGSAARALENGEKKIPESGNLPTAPPSNSGSLTSSMQKAAFERNFPSLGAQEKGGGVSGTQASLGNLVISSPRHLWQGSSTPRMDEIRSAASSPGLPTGAGPGSGLVSTTTGGSNGEGWSSALAEVPSAVNGTLIGPLSSSGTAITSLTSALASISVTGNMTNPPKMAEALVYVPPRVRTPPQYSAEKERLEERALQQSRQLIPMVPKILGPSPRDKKVERTVHVTAPPNALKPRQAMGSSQQVLSSPYRPPASRPEALKLGQGTGKFLTRKVPIKEVVPVSSPSPVNTVMKAEASPLVATGLGLPGMGGGSSPSVVGVLNSASRKQKQLLDRRAVPIPPVSIVVNSDGNSAGTRSKDGDLFGGDERRPSVPTQNRLDFFNALRRKAGLDGPPNIVDKMDVVAPKSDVLVNDSVQLLEDVSEHSVVQSYSLDKIDRREMDTTVDGEVAASDAGVFGAMGEENCELREGMTEGAHEDQVLREAVGSLEQKLALGEGPSEDEEMSFLISLGWSQADAEETDALTQDEIDAFIQKRNELTSLPSAQKRSRNHQQNHNHRRLGLKGRMDVQVGSIESETSCVTTSDSESD
ncbi:uncharacterized protein [Physcomitrium patens]|uniref:Uncharacterized protein n=1 Tax=Physcomitrium patens TaxID=3218 RepID=A0A2K1JEF9_PHYPA|nr:uncharacterized protein LOC112292414 isoform X1 [Physcomitrium patens]PNR39912.1 hypothetical protein PHYPA_020192 [Physcomitrium patens]|eukprot:XP_024396638.1 uncharacterized protein LOC112292414 isoform X1 [Physcomitrella patens]